jgi:hypothetical protein
MTTTAATWFYAKPESRPYFVAERVRTSFWDQRFGSLWLDTVSAEPPLAMQGTYQGQPVRMEWEPGRWFRLLTRPEAPTLAGGVNNLLRRKPLMRYQDPDGHTVWEWWVQPDEAERRWQEVQGKPAYGNPQRLHPPAS